MMLQNLSSWVSSARNYRSSHARRSQRLSAAAPAPWPALGDRVAINFYGSMEAFPHTKTSIYNKLIKPLEAFNLKVRSLSLLHQIGSRSGPLLLAAPLVQGPSHWTE